MSFIKTPISILLEFMQKANRTPQYDFLSSEGLGSHNPMFRFRVIAGKVIGFGRARSKKKAKQEAAKDALRKFSDLGLYVPEQSVALQLQTSTINQKSESSIGQKNAVGMLQDFIAKNDLPPADFTEVSRVGPTHHCLFTLQCTVGNLKVTASKYTKKKAKKACALLMYQHLLENISDTDSAEPDPMNNDERPKIDDVLKEYSNTSIKLNKKEQNYKLKISEFPRTFNKIMNEKNLSFADLWQDVDSPTEKNLEKVLGKLDLTFSFDTFNNGQNFIYFLKIDSEPFFSIAKIAASIQEALPHLLAEAFEFLKIMTTP